MEIKLQPKDVKWVVNSWGELGVKIGEQFFWLYKGESIEYKYQDFPEKPMTWRYVEKREFGEVCHPLAMADQLPRFRCLDPSGGERYEHGEDWQPLPGLTTDKAEAFPEFYKKT